MITMMTQTAGPFSEWLRRRRKALDLTQTDLARLVGCSAVLIAKIEAGERRPSKQIAGLLAEHLDVPIAQREQLVQFARGGALGPATAGAVAPALAAPQASVTPVVVAAPVRAAVELPHPPHRLIGRERDLARVEALLAEGARLISIVGPGGMGKTHLAVEVARRRQLPEAYFVALASAEGPTLAGAAIAAAIGVEYHDRDRIGSLARQLAGRPVLLILDNVEHLLTAGDGAGGGLADLIAALLGVAPELRVIVTSRERLALQHEWVVDLAGLAEAASGSELFIEMARRVQFAFSPDHAERQAIAQICRMVGGLPLAIKLAAAWTSTLSCAEIAAELGRSPDLLASSTRDIPARHRSIRAIFEQTWAMLGHAERGVLARIALFRAGCTREAATFVARARLPQLAGLVQKSLIWRGDEGRYDLHPLVRHYSSEQLAGFPDAAEVRQRFVDYHLALAAQANEAILGPEQVAWVQLLDREHDNLRAALELALAADEAGPATPVRCERGARLCAALMRYWRVRGHFRESIAWAARYLARGDYPEGVRARLLTGASRNAGSLDDWALARSYAEQALAIRRRDSDPAGTAHALLVLGEAEEDLLDYQAARAHLEEALAIFTRLDDEQGLSLARNALANVLFDLGDTAGARQLHLSSLAHEQARGGRLAVAISQANIGLIDILGDDHAGGLRRCREALAVFAEIGNQAGMIFALEGIAAVTGLRGRPAAAARLFGYTDQLRESIQMPVSPANRAYHERFLAMAQGDLAPPQFGVERLAGRRLSEGEALGLARG